MMDSMGPGKLVHHMQNPSFTYDEYLICIGLGPSMLSVICKNLSYSGPSYPSSPVVRWFWYLIYKGMDEFSLRDARIGRNNPSNAEAASSKAPGCKSFWKPSKPCHVGIH